MVSILIVEDEERVRVLAESYVREQGHQTLSAATKDQAPAVFEVAKIDLLFVDLIRRLHLTPNPHQIDL
jgi:DNA-binding response OmpR family regulator